MRRATIQEKKAKKQGMIAVVFGVIILLVFVFVLVPMLFDLAVRSARQGSGPTLQADTLPPQRPVMNPLPPFSKETEYELKGYTEADAQVSLVIDGVEAMVSRADDDGAFSFTFSLTEGEHDIWTVAQDEAGNVSPESERYAVTVDVTAPTVSLESPTNGQVFTLPRERVLTIKGKVSEAGIVFVRGSRVSTDSEGNFSTTMSLGEGANEITYYAQDFAENTSEEHTLTVEYRP